jgi:guanylate kinase
MSIFLSAPNFNELENRLIHRSSESKEDIDRLVRDNVKLISTLPNRFRKDIETNVTAWRKTIDG